MCDEARGFALPDGWVESFYHGSILANCDSIASNGLVPGGLAGEDKRANCNFSATDWRLAVDADYVYPQRFDAPQIVPYRPSERCDAIYIFNSQAMKECGLDPR